ncbi:SPOR domain-containing protein [Edaphobacter modestus]|uniref:Sporulation related protein n=1 Tax=Edaphobacter modestus TaxID=388466 RepID=A0A4Q7YVG9_9BACT|nr:SPOR domain-containing protein [Edaphobacter modestus]RZU41648.1 sporulation related protein [Edaphobacter modestus]
MQLWNEYEGQTIAEAYPLKKLIRPEGRSAFFLTTNGTGTPALVRLIEAHFDEPEILERWRMVSEIKQENLVAMRKYGEAMLDGTPLVYAVMEPTEMSLAELLQNRTLTVDETRQLAASLLGALGALHARDLVHEHIEPSNVLAAGETVKLRSDCVREAASPDGDESEVARKKAADVHDLAIVLLQAMTGRRTLQGSATLLPSPFDGIIRNGLSGKWGLGEMAAALGPVSPVQVAAAAQRPAAQAAQGAQKEPAGERAAKPPVTAGPITMEPGQSSTKASANLFDGIEEAKTAEKAKQAQTRPGIPLRPERPVRPAIPSQTPDVRHRIVKPVQDDPRRMRLWIVAAVAIVLILFFVWRLTRSGATAGASADARPTTAQPAEAASPSSVPHPTPVTPPPAATDTAAASTPSTASTARTQWHVVAYTYNHEAQAQQKAEELKKQHSSLNPEVFSPNGRAPYLVTVGGAMTREEAAAFKRKARGAGLPRDLYTQNYAR